MNSTAANKKIAVSLFSGVGGFDLGFNAAGFEIAIAIDNNPIALATYQHNFPHATVLCKDIREVTGEEIRAHIQTKYVDWDGEIHTVFGGPPCQGFSVAGLQNVKDERNSLVGEFVRLVLELNPLAAIMENVPGIENQKFGCITANLQAVLEEHYFLSKWNLNASDYGVPQARKRVFFVASKFGEIIPPEHQPQHTVRDAIADLLPVPLLPKQNTQEWHPDWVKGEYAKYLEKIFPNLGIVTNIETGFAATTHTPEVIQQFINTPPGAREAKSKSKKLQWDGFCVTLRAGSGNRTALRPLHPEQPRVISVREAARLHSYPDWFNFSEAILHAQREIGNSVPPLLAYAVGMQVREHLECNTTYQIKCQNWQNCLFFSISCSFKNIVVFINEMLSLSGLSKISKERSPPHLATRKQNLLLVCRSGEIINDYFNRGLCASFWGKRPLNRGNPQELIDGYGLPSQQILREAIADYHAKIKSQEKEQSQEETAESEVVVVESRMLPQMKTSPTESEKAIEVNSRLKQNEQTSTSNATEQQPVGEEVSMLAEKLKSATSYYQIRSAIYRHLAVKDEAWKQLSPEEQLKIERLLPQEVLSLKTARESGLIIDYYELETGWFQIFITGEDKPVSVSKSSIITWVQEQERLNCVTI